MGNGLAVGNTVHTMEQDPEGADVPDMGMSVGSGITPLLEAIISSTISSNSSPNTPGVGVGTIEGTTDDSIGIAAELGIIGGTLGVMGTGVDAIGSSVGGTLGEGLVGGIVEDDMLVDVLLVEVLVEVLVGIGMEDPHT